ncbi:MAG: magnesium transporter CorA family protein [Minisyncoccota bacterium]
MIQKYTWNKETWVDINQGTLEELDTIVSEYDLDPFVAKELVLPTPKSRIEFHKEYIYLILHFPVFKHTHGKKFKQEIDFVIGKHFLLTAHYDTIDALHKLSKQVEVDEILSKNHKTNSGHDLFGLLFREFYSSINDELAYIESWTESITDDIFEGQEKEMVFEISEAIRTLLDFKKTTDSHKEILDFLREGGEHILGKTFKEEIDAVLLEYSRIRDIIASDIEILRELRETNNSLLSTKQNETMKTLTVLAFITLPLTFISGVFAMNVPTPFAGHPYGFYIVVAFMTLVGLCVYSVARIKKWL